MKLRESFIKLNNQLFAQIDRILVDEFANGRKDAMAVVTTEDGKTAAKMGILTPVVVSPDPQKRKDDAGRPMLQLHNGERRVRMSMLAKANNFYGLAETTPLLIDGVLCIPVTMDKAANYAERKDDLTRQMILNSGVNWTDTDMIEAAIEYVDRENGKAEDFAIAATVKRETVQKFLLIGRTEGLLEMLKAGEIKNVSVAHVCATQIKKRKGKLTVAILREILETLENQTAGKVEAAITAALGDIAKKTTKKTKDLNKENDGNKDLNDDKGGKSYSFCKEVTKLHEQVQDAPGFTLYAKEIVGLFARGFNEKLTVVELMAELKDIEASRQNLFVE